MTFLAAVSPRNNFAIPWVSQEGRGGGQVMYPRFHSRKTALYYSEFQQNLNRTGSSF